MYKRLFFYFYAMDGFDEMFFYRIHLSCLEYYAKIFDEAVFVISVKDLNNVVLIEKVKHEVLNHFKCKRISFKVHEDDEYHESRVFYDMVYKKLGQLDGLTFFAHTKGVCNNEWHDVTLDWVLGLYWLSLSDINNMEMNLVKKGSLFYGPFLTKFNTPDMMVNKYSALYGGTFYWFDAKKVKSFIGNKNFKLSNRWFTEFFPGEVCDVNLGLSSPSDKCLISKFDGRFDENFKYFIGQNKNKFNKFKRYILN